MDCPYIIKIDDIIDYVSGCPHIDWLIQNNITRYRWTQRYDVLESKSYLIFRFESEEDKILFALRWA